LYRKVKDWRRSENCFVKTLSPNEHVFSPSEIVRSSKENVILPSENVISSSEKTVSEVVKVLEVTRNMCAGMWKRNKARKTRERSF